LYKSNRPTDSIPLFCRPPHRWSDLLLEADQPQRQERWPLRRPTPTSITPSCLDEEALATSEARAGILRTELEPRKLRSKRGNSEQLLSSMTNTTPTEPDVVVPAMSPGSILPMAEDERPAE
jgi:hypothetical protein